MIPIKTKNKLFETAYEDNVVLTHIIHELSWKHIHELLRTNPLLRGKCKCFDKNKIKKENEQDIKRNILTAYAKDEKLKQSLYLYWQLQTESEAELIRKYPKTNELCKYINSKDPKLGIITQLWYTRKEDNKVLADALFETYLRVKQDGGNRDMEKINSELLNRSLLEVLEEVATTKQKMVILEKSLQEKDAQITELKKQIECLAYTKELKGKVTKISTNVDKLTSIVEKQQLEQATKFTEMVQQLQQLEKTFVRENRDGNKKQQEVFKNAIDQMNSQVAKQVAKGISGELKSIFEEIHSLKEQDKRATENKKKESVQVPDLPVHIVVEEQEQRKQVSSIEEELLNELKMFGI